MVATIPITSQRIVEAFMAKVDVFQSDQVCWEWKKPLMTSGYGFLSLGRPDGPNHFKEGAHRLSYQIFNGEEIPEGMVICHKCDNKSCVNPKHLFLGTYKDNSEDCKNKGRNKRTEGQKLKLNLVRPRGEKHFNSNLSTDVKKLKRDSKGRFIKNG